MNTSRLHHHRVVVIAFVATAISIANYGRADAPVGRYTTNNGIVKDNKTGLLWQQNIDGGSYTWANAKAYCMGLNLNGADWRLPSMKELQTIVDESKIFPAIDINVFPSTPSSAFWTSSPRAGDSTFAWFVHFSGGNTGYSDMTIGNAVRCVR